MSLFRAKKGASLSGEAAVALYLKAKSERSVEAVLNKDFNLLLLPVRKPLSRRAAESAMALAAS